MRSLAALLLSTSLAFAGSPYPGYPIDQLQIINDGPLTGGSELTPLCKVDWFDVGWPGVLKGNCILQWGTPMRHARYNLLLQGLANRDFHTLHPRYGYSIPIISIWDEGHKSTDRMWVGMQVLIGQGIEAGMTTELIANGPCLPAYWCFVMLDAR